MTIRFLHALLIAVGLALAPFAMPMGEASAAAPGHHSAMVKADANAGHCDDMPAPKQADHHKAKPCCAAGCMSAAMLPALAEALVVLPDATERPGLDCFHRGVLGEIATPPPRLA